MPANLTPQYFDAEERLRLARTPEEKIEILQEMLSIMPKHKGTDHLQGDIKRKISHLKQEQLKKAGGGRRRPAYVIDREGAGQVAIIGVANVGKSSLLAGLTRATPTVAEYPFTTRMPAPGMMMFREIQIQLIDTPAITVDMMESWMPGLVQAADAALLVVDLGADDPLRQVEEVVDRLAASNVRLRGGCIGGDGMGRFDRPTIVLANKADLSGAEEILDLFREIGGDTFPICPVSARERTNLEVIARKTFEILDLICVFTKEPGKKKQAEPPYALRRGSTIQDLARAIHRDFPDKLRSSRVWGSSKFDGQIVDRLFVLADNDTVELTIAH